VKARIGELSPRVRVAIAAAAVLVWAFGLWFLLVAPKRAEVSRLQEEVAVAELQLAEARATANRPGKKKLTPITDVVRLSKAMPSSAEQSSLVLELAALARRSRVTLGTIAPETPKVDSAGVTVVPVAVTVTGSYGRISRFLAEARKLVAVSRGELRASGRLFSVQGVELSEAASGKFPQLDATITLHAFTYDGPITPPTPPTPTPTEDTTTSGATAAGGTP
jgi:Tfp pilus assembly protein PilO